MDALVKSDICVTGQTCLDLLWAGCPTKWDAIRKMQARLGKKMSSKWGKGGGRGGNVW